MKTKSFTLRLPTDILEKIEGIAGEGKRSETIIRLLRESLGLDAGQAASAGGDLSQIVLKLDLLQKEQDNILQRLANLEENHAPQRKTRSKTESTTIEPVVQSKTESKTGEGGAVLDLQGKTEGKTIDNAIQSKTESKTIEPVVQSKAESKTEGNVQKLLAEDTEELERKAVKINSDSLLEILRKESPDIPWSGSYILKYRTGDRQHAWQNVGSLSFKYAGSERPKGNRQAHFWLAVYPGLESQPQEDS